MYGCKLSGGQFISHRYQFITLMISPIAIITLLLLLAASGAQQSCPQLCSYNCINSTCATCYPDFIATNITTSSCACPTATFLNTTTNLCLPCPITCLTCFSYSKCTTCIPGFLLSNSFTCISGASTANGWVSKEVSLDLNGTILTGSNIVIVTNGSSVWISQTSNLTGTCSKLPTYNWLGGNLAFGYSARLGKTLLSLPPHQWINVRFQAVLIDKWTSNTLILEFSSGGPYSVIWQGTFSSQARFMDFCGNSSIPDNMAIVDAWVPHNVSSAKLVIRLNESDLTATSQLNQVFFAVRELFVRVGTCGKGCRYCAGPSKCTECILPYTLSQGLCVCNISFGFVTASGCSANCLSGYYYNATANSCLNCQNLLPNCQTCNFTTCFACALGYFYSSNNSKGECVRYCRQGFTENRSTNLVGNQTVILDQCVPCPTNCKTCNFNICLFCLQGYFYSQGSCVSNCPSTTFPNQGSCSRCPSNCLTCTASACSLCANGFLLSTSGCLPLCFNTTIVATTNRTCNIACASNCLSCYGSASNQCLACSAGYLQEGSCVSVCNTEYYLSNNQCIRCALGCQTCSSPLICLTCSSGYYFVPVSNNSNNGSCVRLCPSSTFPTVGSGNLTVCSPCATGCQRCKNANFCMECSDEYYAFNFTCLQNPPPSFYFDRYYRNFKPCQPNCLMCNQLVCYRCANGFFLNQGVCVTDCGPYKYKVLRTVASSISRQQNDDEEDSSDDGSSSQGSSLQYGFCQWRSPKCDAYDEITLSGSCSQCGKFEPSLVLRTALNNLTSCFFSCPQFYTQSSNTCVQCPRNCRRCTANLQCLECIYGYVINAAELISNLTNETCILYFCPTLYFSDSFQCQRCVSKCEVCQMDGRCLTCASGFNISRESGICYRNTCTPTQFYSDASSSCASCVAPCLSCISNIQCTSCILNAAQSYYLYQESCVSSCPTGFFAHSQSGTCRKCNPKCATCLSFYQCLTCIPNYYLLSFYNEQQPQCVAECPIGFYSDTQRCNSCYRDCKSCYGPSQFQCLTCYPNFVLDQSRCVYKCSDNKYRDEYGRCDWCDSSCNQCNGPTAQNCISCGLGYYISDKVCYKDECPGATYLAHVNERICVRCQFGCSKCTSPQFCRFCFPGYYLYRGWCYQKCPGNLIGTTMRFVYLDNIEGYVCKECLTQYSSNCLRCSQNFCTKCANGYYLYKNSQLFIGNLKEQCVTVCPNGTYVKSSERKECVSCQTNCMSCVSYQNCTKCNYPYNLINGYCSTGCPSGTYLTSYLNCSACASSCLTCSGASSCSSCQQNFYLLSSTSGNSCVSSCPAAYFADARSGWCIKCLPTCSACTSTNNCTQCLTGFSLTNGICQNQTTTCPSTTLNCQVCSGQNCLRCVQPYLLYLNRNTSVSSCVSTCPVGFFASLFTCQSCNSSCAACFSSASNCSQCSSGRYLLGQDCVAVCPVGFYASSATQSCQACPSNCISCQLTTCYACQNGFFLSDGQCVPKCARGFYGSVSSGMCYACPSNCDSCSADENCTSCASSYILYEGICLDDCPKTTYLFTDASNNNSCLPCQSPCFTCTQQNTCISCIPNYILNGTVCQQACSNGYYSLTRTVSYQGEVQSYDFSNFTQCYPCDISCSVCSTASNVCQACNSPYILYGTSCISSCPAGTFLNGTTCLSCSPSCLACTSPNVCSICANNTILYNSQCLNYCPNGFFIVNQGNSTLNQYICQACSPGCMTCSGPSLYECLSCINGTYLTPKGECVSICPSGTYPNMATQTCSACRYGCSQCSSLANCTSCIANYTLTSTNQCIYSSNCTIPNCQFCSAASLNACAQCLPNYYLLNSTCISTCPAGTYSQNGQCLSCPSNCIACTASACLICNTSFYLFQGACTRQCPAGTYPSVGKCTSDPCLVYNPSSSDCLQCANPYLLYNTTLPSTTNTTSYLQICVMNCPTATVRSGSTCLPCSPNCLQCLSPSICSNCTSGTFLFQGSCQTSCPVGAYPSSGGCQSCTLAFCSQCVLVNGVQSCTSCSATSGAFLANGICVIVCPAGTYASTSTMTCISCLQNCGSCLNAQSCSSCSSGFSLYLGQCVPSCPAGTFSNAGTCSPCSNGCIQCSSATSCTLCQSTLSLLTTTSSSSCITACPNGQYSQAVLSNSFANSNQFTCVACNSPCLTCQSATSCTLCVSGYYLLGSTCMTTCPVGYFGRVSQTVVVNSVSYSSSVCNSCASPCLTCSGTSTYCLSCPSGYILDNSNNCVSNCLSPTSYYLQTTRLCYNCSQLCYSCYGPGTDNCLSCRPPLQLFSGSCFSTCPFGYYPTAAYVCQVCASNCVTCSGSNNNCTSCASGNFLQFVNGMGSCSGSCPTGYFMNVATQSCTACSSACLSCSSLTQCTACPSGMYLLDQACIATCPTGTIASTISNQNNQASCVPCPSNCATCVSTSACTVCSTGFYLVSGACVQRCPSGTYPSPVSYNCMDCGIAGCLNCFLNSSLLLSCTACQTGMYSFDGICLTACPNGTVPSGSTCQQQTACLSYQWNGFCLTNCPTGTFPAAVAISAGSNITYLTCLNCSPFCVSCNSYATCISCANNTYLNLVNPFDTACVVACPSGTYVTNGTCKNCASPCQTCQMLNQAINCITCLSGFVQLGSLCLTSCPDGYFKNGNQCVACSPLCASCSINATNCDSCKNVNAVAPSCASTVTCTGATYQSSPSSCASCNPACLTCFGPASYECLSCADSSNILISGSCSANCPSRTVRNGTVCVNCPSNCLTCLLSGASVVCSACPAPLILYSGGCIQSCSSLNTASQSFILVNAQCQACSISGCLLCSFSNNQLQCTSCSNNTFLYNNQCISSCPPATAPSGSTCTPCPQNCLTCTTTACLSCNNGSSLLSGSCLNNCGLGFYSLNSVCYRCGATNCLNCSASSCISCQQPFALDSFGQCGNCVSGYFMQGGSCQLCSPQCLTCSGSGTTCTSCNSGFLVFNGSSCVTTCPSGYFATSAGTCTACSISNCQTCSSSSCALCLSGFVLVNQAGQQSCQSSCPASTYLSTSTNTCISCSPSCTNCSSSTSCTQCTNTSVLYLGYCISTCPSGTYSANQSCIACPTGCKTCMSANSCSSCNAGMTLSNGSCSVPANTCQNGYFLNTLNSCSQCFPTCNTCSAGNSNNCLSCFSGYTLVSGVCIQNCDSASFFNTNTSTCQLCASRFSNCQACTSSACLSCSSNYTVVNGACALQCPSATFLSNGVCLSCPTYCQSCSSSGSCTQCLNSTFILINGQCYSSCPPQTYLSASSCASCYQTCLTCAGTSTNCSSCITPYSLYGNSCFVICPNGTYSSNYTCQACASNCQICTSASACTQCVSPYYLINGTCRSQCPSGYYIDSASNRCLQCVSPCLVCSSRNNCISCQSPAVLSNGNCVDSNCFSGAYFDFNLNACVNCTVNNCGYCSSTSCSSCASGFYSIYRSGVLTYCQPACIIGTFADNATMNCSTCFANCFSCVNATWCSFCSNGYYLLTAAGASANECVNLCPLGYYQNSSALQCTPCGSNCVSCINQAFCSVCTSNYYLFSIGNTTSCVNNCPQMYFTPTSIDGTGVCGKCASNCFACVDATNCTQCLSTVDVIVNGNCTPSRCVRCLTCNYNNNTCAVCITGYYLFNNRCLSNCPDGYYKDNSTGTCVSCVENCLLCEQPNSCLLCISGYMFVNGSSCQNAGLIKFGTLGNMSGFTSNITRIMAIVYVSTSSGPIAFGAIGSTYGPMQFCQFMYLLQGSSGGNEQVNHFLNSLSAVSYTTNSGTNDNAQSTNNSMSSQARLLTAINYTSSFLETNLPIFIIMICFTASYFLVLLLKKYNNSCCMSCPTLRKYLSYICDFMQRRFKYIYVDSVMWISYLPFLYFAVLQLQSGKFDTGLNIFSFLLAIVIIIVYPLYPFFILRKIFDRSDDAAEDLRNYKAITLKEPPRVGQEKDLCAEIACCQRKNPQSDLQTDMVEMSLSPFIDKVVRPVYNQFDPDYSQFRYFKIQHWKLAYAAIKYVRKLIYVLIVALCPNPVATLSLLVVVTAIYMAYLIVLKPKQKLYLILEILLESLLLFFIIFMLVYVTQGGASVSSLSIATHAIGFLIANSALAIAIILNLMAYYTIFCCIVDLIRHLRDRAIEDEIKEKAFEEIVDDKEKIDYKDKDKEDIQIRKSLRRGDDQMTVQNNQDENYVPYDLDQKEFNVRSSMINKKKTFEQDEPEEDFTNLRSTKNPKGKNHRRDRKKSNHKIEEESHTSEEIMGQSKVSEQDIEQGLLRDKNSKFKREVNKDDVNIDRGQLRQPTDKFRKRHPKVSEPQEQESLQVLRPERRKEPVDEFVAEIDTQDRMFPQKKNQMGGDPTFAERQARRRDKKKEDERQIEQPYMREREGKSKDLKSNNQPFEGTPYDRQGRPKNEKDIEGGNMVDRERRKKEDPFGFNDPTQANINERNKNNNNLLDANTYERKGEGRKGQNQRQIESGKLQQRERNKKQNPFGEFDQMFAEQDSKAVRQAQMRERAKKQKEDSLSSEKLVSGFLEEGNIIQRNPQPKKYQNLHYKGSDDEQEVIGGQMVQAKNKFKRNKNVSQKNVPLPEASIDAYGKQIKTKKVQRMQSNKDFAQDNLQEAKYRERQAKEMHKMKSANQRNEQGIQQATGQYRDKRVAEKRKPEAQPKIENNNLLNPSPVKPSKKQNLFNDLAEDITQSVEFNDKPAQMRQKGSNNSEEFEQANMGKILKTKPQKQKSQKDGKMQVSENLEQSYEDAVRRNKQQVFKQNISANKSNLIEMAAEDDFEEVNYSRPESKIQRPKSRSKDMGLGVNQKAGSEASDNESKEIRKQRNSAIQRQRKKATLNVNQNESNQDEGDVGVDSRRISRIAKKSKSRVRGVLNIEDKSENEDIQDVQL